MQDKNQASYKMRLDKNKHWNFRQVCMANRLSMQAVLENFIDLYIEEQVAKGIQVPPSPFLED